ncbi:MAG: cyclic nucleotide-binding domain-containing protein [Verrucomicrobiales bacterium]|nr:cyclic nucleotide-binding domain-containing protein [Verrucomicrobiales bacterium]
MATASRFPLLSGLAAEHVSKLKECACVQEFRKGDLIFKQGDQANRLYLILCGAVFLSHAGLKRNVLIQTLSAGEVLGWSWLFPPHAWHFNARASEPTRMLVFNGERLRDLCKDQPVFGYELMKRVAEVVIQRLQTTRRKLLKLSGDS